MPRAGTESTDVAERSMSTLPVQYAVDLFDVQGVRGIKIWVRLVTNTDMAEQRIQTLGADFPGSAVPNPLGR